MSSTQRHTEYHDRNVQDAFGKLLPILTLPREG